MRPGALNELLAALSRRAGLSRRIHPHQLRYGCANVAAAGGTLDEIRELLGHAFIGFSQCTCIRRSSGSEQLSIGFARHDSHRM